MSIYITSSILLVLFLFYSCYYKKKNTNETQLKQTDSQITLVEIKIP